MATDPLNDSGLQALCFREEGSEDTVDFADLPALEWVLVVSDVTLEGTVAENGQTALEVTHSFAGRELGRAAAKNGRFLLPCALRRGRNTFVVEFPEGAREPWSFDVFHKGRLRNWIEPFVKIACIFVLIQTFVIKAFYIPSGSMENTFFPGDYILVDRVSLLFDPPARGDVLVFQYPRNPTQDFIKRLVGLPGDSLAMRDKVFLRNGKPVEEPYIVNKDFRRFAYGFFGRRDEWGPLELPPGKLFMMGDNRDFSKDSRFWGPLDVWRLKGRALLRYMPLKRWGLVRHGRHVFPGAPADPPSPQ